MKPGDIYRHDRFYVDSTTGEVRPKYLLFMAPTRSGDWVVRLLTSRAHARPRQPPCFHGDPYPGYFLGAPGPPIERDTWIDLRGCSDVDVDEARVLIAKGVMHNVSRVESAQFRPALECAAGAADTTRHQEQAIRDQLARLT